MPSPTATCVSSWIVVSPPLWPTRILFVPICAPLRITAKLIKPALGSACADAPRPAAITTANVKRYAIRQPSMGETLNPTCRRSHSHFLLCRATKPSESALANAGGRNPQGAPRVGRKDPAPMLRTALVRIVDLSSRFAWAVVGVAAVLTAFCLVYGVRHF